MIPFIIALAVLLGAGGTVVASDAARPGDLLFPVDRAVEEVRATFASAEGKVELKVKFAEERLDEMDSILDEENATSTPNGVSEEAKLNLSYALDILIMHLVDIHGEASTTPGIAQAISVIEDRLQDRMGDLPQELKIKIRDDRGRIELKTEEGKIKVKIDSDGEIEVEIEDEGEDSDDSDDDKEDNKGSNSGPGKGTNATSTKPDNDDSDDNDDDDNSGSGINAGASVKVEVGDDEEDEDEDEDGDSTDDSDDDDNSGSGSSGSNSGSSNN